jgi:hypothetical protein
MRKLLVIIVLLSMLGVVSGLEYFTFQMNFQPGESRSHLQELTYTGDNLSITVPQDFTLDNYSAGATVSGNVLTWGAGAGATVNYTLSSPSNCTDGSLYFSNITLNGSYVDQFVFACVPDSKIVDYKGEYGHGDANYLNDYYLSNESATLFNLIRVFNIGHFLDGDEAISNAQINCTFEDFPVRTYGRVDVKHLTNAIRGDFLWNRISSGYWFRIGVLSQDVADLPVGDFYNISCTDLTYDYEHQRVQAGFEDIAFEIRTIEPFTMTVTNASNSFLYNLKNTEEYRVCDVQFSRTFNGQTTTEYLPELLPGESVQYLSDDSGFQNVTVFFVPSWYCNSRNPTIYRQTTSAVGGINVLPNITSFTPINITQSMTENSDLLFTINKTDANNDTLTTKWYVDGSLKQTTVDSIPYVVDVYNFTTDCTDSGVYNVSVTVEDNFGFDTTSWSLTVNETCSPPAGGGGGGGGGGGSSGGSSTYRPPTCREQWSCSDWGDCRFDVQTRTCTDTNRCGTTIYQPAEVQSCEIVCEEDWFCSEWGSCEEDSQTRDCVEVNRCGTVDERPELMQACTSVEVPAPVVKKPDWCYFIVTLLLLFYLIIAFLLERNKYTKKEFRILHLTRASLIVAVVVAVVLLSIELTFMILPKWICWVLITAVIVFGALMVGLILEAIRHNKKILAWLYDALNLDHKHKPLRLSTRWNRERAYDVEAHKHRRKRPPVKKVKKKSTVRKGVQYGYVSAVKSKSKKK